MQRFVLPALPSPLGKMYILRRLDEPSVVHISFRERPGLSHSTLTGLDVARVSVVKERSGVIAPSLRRFVSPPVWTGQKFVEVLRVLISIVSACLDQRCSLACAMPRHAACVCQNDVCVCPSKIHARRRQSMRSCDSMCKTARLLDASFLS